VGRRDQQVKLRGYRIELGEIEAAVRQLSGVQEAVVLLREDTPDNRRLVAYIVPKAGATLSSEALQQELRARLPEYMVPAVIVVLDAFPLTSNGKIDRRRLPAPDAERTLARTFVAPRTAAEEIIAGVWAEVLRLNRVGVHDNFLSIGGDSLNAVQVLVRLREAFGREIPLRTLLEHTTPEALAAELLRTDGAGVEEPPLERVSRGGVLPVSFGQERLWVVDRVTGSQAYHVPVVAQLTGEVHPGALADAVTALAARHEVLRTTIGMHDGRPVQEIAPPADVPVPWVDLSALTPAQRTRATEIVVRALESSPFDLRVGPLWRVTIVRLDANTYLFTCILHHIVADGWSMGVLLRDLAELYEASRTGQQARLPELKVQYADYAAWQRGALAGGRQATELAYWRTQLADVTTLALPTDRPRGPVPSVKGGVVSDRWDLVLSRDVQTWARAQGATLFMVMLAAWQALLARHSGQSDVAVGVPVAQRPRPELEPLIGFFLNTLVMRTPVPGTTTWRALVADVRARALAAFAHQTVPFERIIEELQPERDLTRTPFFQVLFVLQNNPHRDLMLEGLTLSPLPGREYASKYDLTLHVTPRDEGMECTLQYDASLFDRTTTERLLQHFKAFVRAALAAPDVPLATLSLLSDAERSQISATNRFPRTSCGTDDWPIEQSIVDRFQEQVARRPSRIAVKTRRAAWTYRELNQHANRIARAIVRATHRTSGRVALLCRHDEMMLAAVLGALKAGHAYVPLDPGAPIARLRQVWNDAEPVAIVTTDMDVTQARELAEDRPVIVTDRLEGTSTRFRAVSKIVSTAPAYILYTSGSTGQPKGVVQNHRNVLHFIRAYAANLQLGPADKLTLLSGYGFDASVMDIFGAVLNGAALYPVDLRETTPIELADSIDRERITVLHSTPTVFRMLTSSLEANRVLASVRLVVLGGEAAYRSDTDLFREHFNGDCVLVNGLGPTESTVTLQQFITSDTRLTRHALPVGYPVEGTTVRLVDEGGRDAEVFGEIEIESPHVAVGYWRRDDLTQSAFSDGGPAAGTRRYRTGDLGRLLPDGSLEFLGRKDHQVKIRGHRVELGEIESVLAGHDAIRECVVSSWRDPAGQNRLVAYAVPRTADTPANRVLQRFVASRLPDYMVPATFTWLDALPFRANGKVDRDALPAPRFDMPAPRAYVAPRDPYEQRLSELWTEVLGLDRVGMEDNFFELGGDSIKAIQVAARARTDGVPLTPRLLFQHQTIAELALAVASAGDPIEPVPVDEPSDSGLEMTAAQIAELSSRVEFELS
jgi:amino acid adenylation domain-containing protein